MRKQYVKKKYMKILNRDEIMEIYLLIEELNDIFHDSDRFGNINIIQKFVDEYYPTIHKLYYKILWNALTIDQRKQILEEDYDHKIDGQYD
ncbi:hypothetical protein D0T92_01405 [Neisseria zalophi]|uniref:Uncharacterized protein n=2 Tax=Neisseria zalophi TaxID=640030 RepID=A0A5J6PY46_9NEIS|nr:hypothetical protein D0T92_01405 [Neisseria zalophi]